MPNTPKRLIAAMAAAAVLFSQSAPLRPVDPKPAELKPLSEVAQLKLEVFQLRLEKVSIQAQLLQYMDREANGELNAHILAECVGLGGKKIDDCDMDFTSKPYRMALKPPPPAAVKPAAAQ